MRLFIIQDRDLVARIKTKDLDPDDYAALTLLRGLLRLQEGINMWKLLLSGMIKEFFLHVLNIQYTQFCHSLLI